MSDRIRWREVEWKLVAAHAVPLVDEQGLSPLAAFVKAQRVALPDSRWKIEGSLRHSEGDRGRNGGVGGLTRWLNTLRTMPAHQLSELAQSDLAQQAQERQAIREAKLERLAAARVLSAQKRRRPEYEGGFRWTTREVALVTRHALQARSEGSKKSATVLVLNAQEVVLPADRRRSCKGIRGAGAKNEELLARGKENLWLLDPPAAEVQPEAAPEPQEAPAAPAPAEPAPMAPPARAAQLSDASKAFAETMMGALDVLLGSQAALLLGEVQQKLAGLADQVADKLSTQIRGLVHSALESELGPGVAPPAPAAAPAPPPAPELSRPSRLMVDVLGLRGHNVERVRRAFNGDTDLRFIDVDQAGWEPRRSAHCVVSAKYVSHSQVDRFRAIGTKPIMAPGGPGAVISAIERLRIAAGFTRHH